MNVDLKMAVEEALVGAVEARPRRDEPDALAVNDAQLASMEQAFGSPVGSPTAPPG